MLLLLFKYLKQHNKIKYLYLCINIYNKEREKFTFL